MCGYVYIVYVYVVYMSTYMYERMLDWVHECVCMCIYVAWVCVRCMFVCVHELGCMLQLSRPVW